MATYLFITRPEFKPAKVASRSTSWSCSSKTRQNDRALVYVTGTGIQFEWQVLSDAEPNDEWKYVCDVKYVRTIDPPITLEEIRRLASRRVWSPPYQNFRGLRSIIIPDVVAAKLNAQRTASGQNLPDRLPEEVSVDGPLPEGAVRRISINSYERNPEARRQCIAKLGDTCCICGFNFGSAYGNVAEGYIHVHHLRSLSKIGKRYIVDPKKDMRPVCPNCHVVLHLRDPAYSIEEVQALISQARKAT